LGLGVNNMNVVELIKNLSRKMNLKNKEKDYRYYIVVRNKKVEMILVKSNKNLISELGYFNNEEDCRQVINKYGERLLKIA
jgi:hypothetical protein